MATRRHLSHLSRARHVLPDAWVLTAHVAGIGLTIAITVALTAVLAMVGRLVAA